MQPDATRILKPIAWLFLPLFLNLAFSCFYLAAEAQSSWRRESPRSGQDYGPVSAVFQRIEESLSNAQQNLNPSEYYEFQARLYSLKQSASLELSRGADASAILQPASSLEHEVTNRIKETSQHNLGKKSLIDSAINHLETQLKNRSAELNSDEKKEFSDLIDALKKRVSEASLDDASIVSSILQETHEIESRLLDHLMFPSRYRKSRVSSENEDSAEKNPANSNTNKKAEGKTGDKDDPEKANAAARKNASDKNLEAAGENPKPSYVREKPKPLLPLNKVIENIEEELMDFHDKRQIGSFDMDSFTNRLLSQKRNLHVMMSKTGRISARQENLIRQELEDLHQAIVDRVTGKD